jgi:hypothetical protein
LSGHPDPTGQQPYGLLELKDFGTLTSELLALSDWLADVGVIYVAMESMGEYWRPVYNLLEGTFAVFLVNAAHVKRVPGRKTDKADVRWLAKLMRYGLLQASFFPPELQRDLRDLTRYRMKLVQERTRAVNWRQGCWSGPISNWRRWPRISWGVGARHLGRPGGGTGRLRDHGRVGQKAPAQYDPGTRPAPDRGGARPSPTVAGDPVGAYRLLG